jgi:GNAT superfamily N-acetyltransferase
LTEDVRMKFVDSLEAHPTSLVILAFYDEEPAGIAVCFEALSTFEARPVLNIHDLAVYPTLRGKGVGRALLGAVE